MIEIPETEATGKVAEIYDDIRQTLDMSMVNTIWRNLALQEEVLEWVWYSLKPIYKNGSVRHYASKLMCLSDDTYPCPERHMFSEDSHIVIVHSYTPV